MVHNQVMFTISLFRMRQEMRQSPQSFQDQFMAMRQVCDQLGLPIGQTEQGVKAALKRNGATNPTGEQLKEAEKRPQKYFAIVSIHGRSAQVRQT